MKTHPLTFSNFWNQKYCGTAFISFYTYVYDSCNPQKGKIANILQRYDLSYVGLMMMMTTEELIMYNSTMWLKVHNSNIDLYRSSSYLYIWSR